MTSTAAPRHMPAHLWLNKVRRERRLYDAALLGPPYSSRQIKEHYARIGLLVTQHDTQGKVITAVRNKVAKLVKRGGIVISFGWSSAGMGINRGFRLVEILLIAHGRHHYDTIITVERKGEA